LFYIPLAIAWLAKKGHYRALKRGEIMKKRTILGAFLVAGALVLALPNTTLIQADSKDAVVGAWQVQAVGAPYQPHLFTFNSDGTMLTTNPTNVQESPASPHGGTNDSVGMGPWQPVKGQKDTFIGTFYQLNANADDHTPADTLSVTYKIKVTGDTFTGNALAKQGEFSGPATLNGTRLKIDTSALPGL
jgi:hypothetical protein